MEEEVVEPGCVGGAGGLGARKGQLRGTRTGQVTQVLGLLCRPRWGRAESAACELGLGGGWASAGSSWWGRFHAE